MTVIAMLCAGLRAIDAPEAGFVWLLCWVSAVWCVTLFFRVRVACVVSAAISLVFGVVAMPAVRCNPSPTIFQELAAEGTVGFISILSGVCLSLAIFGVNNLVEGQ